MKCIVIGGGVIGLSIAYQMARRRCQVTLLDDGRVGGGSSWAGAGILPAATLLNVDDPYERLRGYSHQLHPHWARDLQELTGIDTGFRRCGGWFLARSKVERATMLAQRSLWEEQGIEVQHGYLPDVLRHEPSLKMIENKEIDMEGWFVPDECQVRNPRHLQALVAACRQLQVEIREGCGVESLQWQNEKLAAVVAGSQRLEADHYFFATGAWAHKMLNWFGLPNGILPVRGQMLLYQVPPGSIRSVINEGHRYLVPREDGHLLVGSCEEEVGYVCETTEPQMEELKKWAKSMLGDQLPAEPLRAWAGLRPGVFDGMPYIGPLARFPNVWFAAGHFRSGLHLSCATAECLVATLLGEVPVCDLSAFRPDRYWQPSLTA